MNGVVTTFLTRDFPQTPRLLEWDKAIHDITDGVSYFKCAEHDESDMDQEGIYYSHKKIL